MRNNDIHKYDDIINLPHPNPKRHPRMSLLNRAAQFSPFAALTGHEDAIKETARYVDSKTELSEDKINLLNEKLMMLRENGDITAQITYFVPDKHKTGGKYISVTGRIKRNDYLEHTITLADGTVINVDDIYDIEI